MNFDKHRTAQIIKIVDVKNYLLNEGFSDIKLEQQWRHITGSVEKNGARQFFKMATTEGIAERTYNEYHWNNLINENLNLTLPISIPHNYECGKYNNLFWFTCEFINCRRNLQIYIWRGRGCPKEVK